ncbi:MAG: fumarate hydratase [Arenicellales bacterium]|jgi:fumarate hydratase class I|nr:fumarate hydratase [Arenicellales bacterium]MDP6551387.1 fumarate hydratase [Arenicellales bacterium]MDP6791881.1 fumarate hydratase [Arenicellales bacterium]MDP6947736.1 fumarate hydratase [Arenicellales bacterium]|tara:strand:+ start:22341 stop:23858 length:1518 start_codon:yes stop_codon:yes gene_type:complete
MTRIQTQDISTSIADALQYISYYHPPDFIAAMTQAYERETSEPAKNAIAQILINSRMAAQGRRPVCQDTGIVVVFVKIGQSVMIEGHCSLQEAIDEGVRQAYTHPDNPLRASVITPPIGDRKNTGDNTPAVVHTEIVPGNTIELTVAAKGGGSENKARLAMLNPNDDLADWVTETLPSMGAGWCPPGILGIGIGGTPEKAMLMAKESLMAPVDMAGILERGPQTPVEELRLNIYQAVNRLGIGAQGLGGLTTVLDVKIKTYATHAASLPVAMIPNCAATRHIHFTLDGTGPAELPHVDVSSWPEITQQAVGRRVNLDQLTPEDYRSWGIGDNLLLSGRLLTGRDAAHKRLVELLESGEPLPEGVDFTGRFIYYVGPVDPVGDEAVGPAGPTTATRMDKFTESMLAGTGLAGMIGKAERGATAIAAIKKHRSVYLIAVGGAAYLVSKAIRSARVIAFEELGMEAIYEFEVEDMPVTVAVDSTGASVHTEGPREWREKIASFPVGVS